MHITRGVTDEKETEENTIRRYYTAVVTPCQLVAGGVHQAVGAVAAVSVPVLVASEAVLLSVAVESVTVLVLFSSESPPPPTEVAITMMLRGAKGDRYRRACQILTGTF